MPRPTPSSPIEFLLDWIAVQNSAASWFCLIWGAAAVLSGAVITWRKAPSLAPLAIYAIALALVMSQGWVLRWVAAGIARRRRARLLLGGGLSLVAALEWGAFASLGEVDALAAGMMWTWSLVAALNGLLLLGTGLIRGGRGLAPEEGS